MDIRNELLEPNCFYHIFNRGINGMRIFDSEENYHFFLRKFDQYLAEVCEIYAYCLMPNHFHFLIKVKSDDVINNFLLKQNNLKTIKSGLHAPTNIVSKQLGKFISSYSQAYNKVKKRHGPLLESPFKRIKVSTGQYLINLIRYIHLNPLELNQKIDQYKFSSYRAILIEKNSYVDREKVLDVFDGEENFIFCHKS
ncbi:MAG: transposase [Fluviicola sp.]|nr:transposase [Fluviicola sp.]MBP6271790.1 transposase [Fluviicola sp.]